jgi:hypothetical protein
LTGDCTPRRGASNRKSASERKWGSPGESFLVARQPPGSRCSRCSAGGTLEVCHIPSVYQRCIFHLDRYRRTRDFAFRPYDPEGGPVSFDRGQDLTGVQNSCTRSAWHGRRSKYPKLNYPWQLLVLNAFMELDPMRLQSKTNKAARAICERLHDRSLTLRERTALHDALGESQLLLPQNSEHQESREIQNIRAALLLRTRASAAKSRVSEQLSTSKSTALQISSAVAKARMLTVQRKHKGLTRTCPVKGFSSTCRNFGGDSTFFLRLSPHLRLLEGVPSLNVLQM